MYQTKYPGGGYPDQVPQFGQGFGTSTDMYGLKRHQIQEGGFDQHMYMPQLSRDPVYSDPFMQVKQTREPRRTRDAYPGREFVCGCGKDYLTYAALFTHAKAKHNSHLMKGTKMYLKRHNMEIELTETQLGECHIGSVPSMIGKKTYFTPEGKVREQIPPAPYPQHGYGAQGSLTQRPHPQPTGRGFPLYGGPDSHSDNFRPALNNIGVRPGLEHSRFSGANIDPYGGFMGRSGDVLDYMRHPNPSESYLQEKAYSNYEQLRDQYAPSRGDYPPQSRGKPALEYESTEYSTPSIGHKHNKATQFEQMETGWDNIEQEMRNYFREIGVKETPEAQGDKSKADAKRLQSPPTVDLDYPEPLLPESRRDILSLIPRIWFKHSSSTRWLSSAVIKVTSMLEFSKEYSSRRRFFEVLSSEELKCNEILALFLMMTLTVCPTGFFKEAVAVICILHECLEAKGPELHQTHSGQEFPAEKSYCETEGAENVPEVCETFVQNYYWGYIQDPNKFDTQVQLGYLGDKSEAERVVKFILFLGVWLYKMRLSSFKMQLKNSVSPEPTQTKPLPEDH